MIVIVPGIRCEYCGGNVLHEDGDLTCLMCVRAVRGVPKRATKKAS